MGQGARRLTAALLFAASAACYPPDIFGPEEEGPQCEQVLTYWLSWDGVEMVTDSVGYTKQCER